MPLNNRGRSRHILPGDQRFDPTTAHLTSDLLWLLSRYRRGWQHTNEWWVWSWDQVETISGARQQHARNYARTIDCL